MKNVGKIVVFALLLLALAVPATAVCEIGDVTFPDGTEFLRGTVNPTWTWVNASECAAAVAQVSWRINDAGAYTVIGNAVPGGTTLPWDTTTAGGDSPLYRLLVSIASDSDESNNFFTVDNTAPVAEAGDAGYSCTEAGNTPLSSAGSSDATSGIASIDWDLDNDGIFETNGAAPTYNCGQEGTYTINVQVTDNSGNTANDTALVNVSNAPPVVNVLSPNGGEYLRGNVPISWSAVDVYDNLTVTVEYSTDNGTTNNTIVAGVPNNGSITWDTSAINALNVTINVIANDGTVSVLDASNSLFAIDNTAPTASAGADDTINEDLTTALDASASTEVFGENVLLTYAWDFDGDGFFDDAYGVGPTFTPNASILSTYNGVYNVTVQVTDGAGNTATDGMTVTVNNVAPLISLNAPNGGETYTGILLLNWTATDVSDILFVDLAYTTDGTTFSAIASNQTNNGQYAWNTTGLDLTNITVRLTANDGTTTSFDDGALFGDIAEYSLTTTVSQDGTQAVTTLLDDNNLMKLVGNDAVASYTCWFYDSMGPNAEGLCFVANDYPIASANMLLLGVDTGNDNGFYSYFLSPNVASWGTSAVARSLGWHSTTFTKNGVNTDLYIDGNLVASTSNINNWDRVGVMNNNWNALAGKDPGIFDNLQFSNSTANFVESFEDLNTLTGSFAVDGVLPLAEANGPYACFEPLGAVLNSTGSDGSTSGIASIDWDLNNDGTFEVINDPSPTFSCVDDGNFLVQVRITDNVGQQNNDTSNVVVSNELPVTDAGLDFAATEGQLVTLNATYTDLGANDTHNATVDWGDGTPVQSLGAVVGGAFSATHTYADDDADDLYTVTVTVTDDDGGFDSDTADLTITNVAPAVNAGSDQTISEGQTLTVTPTWTDMGSADTHAVIIDWNDGSSTNYGVQTSGFNATHNYDNDVDPSSYTVTVTVTDDDSAATPDTLQATVLNVLPAVQITFPTGGENLSGTVSITWTASDPAVNDTPVAIGVEYSSDNGATWNTIGNDTLNTGSMNWDTTLDLDGNQYLVRIIANDDDGSNTSTSALFTVDNTAATSSGPEASPSPVVSGNNLTLTGTVSDAFAVTGASAVVLLNNATIGNYTMTAVDGAFDESSEDVVVTVDTTGFAAGTYVFYLSARDAALSWQVQTPENTDTFVVISSDPYYTKPQVDAILLGNLSNYYNETEIDSILTNYYNKTQVYNKTEVDSLIAGFLANYYNKTQIDAMFANYYNTTQIDALFANYYSMAQVNAILLGNLSNYYNSTEIDNILLNYYTVADVYNKTEVDTLLTALAANYYTIAQIDAMFANYYTQGQIDAMFANVYTIAQVDALIASELSAYYTSVEVDNILTNYYTVTEVYTKAEVDALIAGLSGTYYTMAQVDALFANYYTQGQVDAMFDFRIIASSPSGVVTDGAQTLAVDTSQTATCKYSTTAFNFNTQGTAMGGSGTTSHSSSLGTLADGTYTYYVQCRDATTNVLTSYFPVTFQVDTAGNFNYVQDLNLNWNALFLPNPSIIFGPAASGNWEYNSAWTLKEVLDNSGIAGSYSIVWYYNTATNSWKSFADDGNPLNDDLTTVNNRNDQPYWVRMTAPDRFEAAPVIT